jgi:hypothetical protein
MGEGESRKIAKSSERVGQISLRWIEGGSYVRSKIVLAAASKNPATSEACDGEELKPRIVQ